MRPRKPLVVASVVLLAIAIAAAAGYALFRRMHPASLAAWSDVVAGADYQLRYRTRTKIRDVAIFQVGPDRLAFCSRYRGIAAGIPPGLVRVTDVAGNDLLDAASPIEQLERVWRLGIADYRIVDGLLIPIRPGFNGRMRIVLDTAGAECEAPSGTSRFDIHIDWGEPPREPPVGTGPLERDAEALPASSPP